VLANLLNNATKFTSHGTITISTKKSDDTNDAIVTIKDGGSGIDPEIIPHLFQNLRQNRGKVLV
jgi:signal transduction histidine kinase